MQKIPLFYKYRSLLLWLVFLLFIVLLVVSMYQSAIHGHGLGLWAWLIDAKKTSVTTDPVKGNSTSVDYRQPHIVTLVQPLLGVSAGLIALWQFMDKRKQEREHFDRKEQEDRFKDIQDRFASADEKTRASAALRLAEMARLPRPDAKGGWVCEENYPFFLRVAALLAIALHIEKDGSVRAANVDAITSMIQWIQLKQKDDLLLRLTVTKIYDANITAVRAFIKALAEYCNTRVGQELDFQLLTVVAPFTKRNEMTKQAIISLMATDAFKAYSAIHQQVHGLSSDDLHKLEGSLLSQVRIEAARLMDVRDALTVALCALSPPSNMPQVNPEDENWLRFKFTVGLRLESAFLAGAYLLGAQLPAVHFRGACLTDAAFPQANLEGGDFFDASIEGAFFENTNLRSANFVGTHLEDANFYSTDVSKANFYNADLSRATFSGTKLLGTKVFKTKLVRTVLNGAILQKPDGSSKADFRTSDWREADFSNTMGEKNQDIWNWFEQNVKVHEGKTSFIDLLNATKISPED